MRGLFTQRRYFFISAQESNIMPWSIIKQDGRYCLRKDDTGDIETCHDTREQAERHMAALYAAEKKALDFDEMSHMLRMAFDAQFRPMHEEPKPEAAPEAYVVVPTDEYVIVARGAKYFKVTYAEQDGNIVFAPVALWQEVEEKREWVEKLKALRGDVDEQPKPITSNALKAVSETEDELRVANYIVLFGGRDLEGLASTQKNGDGTVGEYFTPQTDLESEYTKSGVLHVDWEHGYDPDEMGIDGDAVLGYVDWKSARRDERGVFVERVLNRRAKYMEFIEELIKAGLIGTSSEAVNTGVQKKNNGEIVRWPLRRDSMTVTPMEPRMIQEIGGNALAAFKALADAGLVKASPQQTVEQADVEPEQQAEPEASGDDAEHGDAKATEPAQVKTTSYQDGELDMNEDELKSTVNEQIDAKLAPIGDQLSKILKYMEDSPALRKSGLFTQDGGNADPHVKSFGDFLMAVKRGDVKRLREVYKSTTASTTAMEEDQGEAGGYSVPTEYRADLLKIAAASSQVVPLAQRFTVAGDAGTWPALDYFTAPTAGVGNTAMAAGLTASQIAERGTYNERRPEFTKITYRVNKVGDVVPVSNELVSDSPVAIEGLLRELIGIAIGAKEEYYMLRGTGSGMPLGILNAPAAVGIAPDTDNYFGYADAVEMVSRFKRFTNNVRWVWHPSVMPDEAVWEVGTAGAATRSITDLGYGAPINSEHLPQADNSGCVGLFDLGAYIFFDKGGLSIAYSEHAYFSSGEVAWRFDERIDGQPWLKNSITLADPQGSFTQSPFIYLND